jgi:hypothetical protein
MRYWVPLLAIALGLIMSACGSQDSAEPLVVDLQETIAYELFVDEAEVLSVFELERHLSVTGTIDAQAGHRFGSSESDQAIEAALERELTSLGWRASNSISRLRTTAETYVRVWERDGIVLRFALPKRDHLLVARPEYEAFASVFDIVLIGGGADGN